MPGEGQVCLLVHNKRGYVLCDVSIQGLVSITTLRSSCTCHIKNFHQSQIIVVLKMTRKELEFIEGRNLIKYDAFKRHCCVWLQQSIQQKDAICMVDLSLS